MQECCKMGPYISHFKKLSGFAVSVVRMRGMQVLYVSADGNDMLCNVFEGLRETSLFTFFLFHFILFFCSSCMLHEKEPTGQVSDCSPCISIMCVRACKLNKGPPSILFLFEEENAP